MAVRLVAPAGDHLAILVKRSAFDDVRRQMQLVYIDSDQLTRCVVPRACTNAIAC